MHFVSVLISGIRNWLIHLRSRKRDSKRRCCSPVFLVVAQWTTDKYQKRQRKIFGQGEKPQQNFWFFVIPVVHSVYQSHAQRASNCQVHGSLYPKQHLTFTFLNKALQMLSQHCPCTCPKNKIDTGHLFLAVPNFFQSGSLKVSV